MTNCSAGPRFVRRLFIVDCNCDLVVVLRPRAGAHRAPVAKSVDPTHVVPVVSIHVAIYNEQLSGNLHVATYMGTVSTHAGIMSGGATAYRPQPAPTQLFRPMPR